MRVSVLKYFWPLSFALAPLFTATHLSADGIHSTSAHSVDSGPAFEPFPFQENISRRGTNGGAVEKAESESGWEKAERPSFKNEVRVEKNDLVRLQFHGAGLVIATEGRSLGEGEIGERVRVLNISSNETVIGVIRADGAVSVHSK